MVEIEKEKPRRLEITNVIFLGEVSILFTLTKMVKKSMQDYTLVKSNLRGYMWEKCHADWKSLT